VLEFEEEPPEELDDPAEKELENKNKLRIKEIIEVLIISQIYSFH
tara:strand:- start:372 stop:506 length:135 start_codon:yes stop_codon:yes gene_type:complete